MSLGCVTSWWSRSVDYLCLMKIKTFLFHRQLNRLSQNHEDTTEYEKWYGFLLFTARKRSLRRLCLHRCLSIHKGGGESAPLHAGIHKTPLGPGRHPPGADTPQEQTPPPGADTPPEQTPPAVHAGRYGQQAGGTHPTGMHSCVFS